MTKNNRCKFCELPVDGKHQLCQLQSLLQSQNAGILGGFYLQQLKDMMLAAYLLKGYYQPAGPLIQHPPTLPTVKGPPPEPTPTPPQNSEGSDDLVATSTTSGGTSSTGGGFYRSYCPQYYATPPQYQELCYPPSYSHSHPHPPPYYHKYAPPYPRQYYRYQEAGAGGGPGGSGAGPGVVEYQPPPGEYLPPYYGGYPPPPPPPPPPPNPAYLHSQGRPFVDHAFQSCPCPMQSCPKNADTGPLIGNGKGAPVVSGPGLSLPPSALVGPPSPARGLAGLAPPHGANAWDTDRVQLNPVHRGNAAASASNQQQQQHHQQSKQQQQASTSAAAAAGSDKDKCEVKLEQSVSPASDEAASDKPASNASASTHHHHHLHHHHHHHHHSLKLENNNVKCESRGCLAIEDGAVATSSAEVASVPPGQPRVKCEMLKCEQCVKEAAAATSQLAICEMDKDSGILEDDAGSGKLETDTEVKEELNALADADWKKPDYEPTAPEPLVEDDEEEAEDLDEGEPEDKPASEQQQQQQQQQQHKCQKLTKRKLSLDSLSDIAKLKKINKRTMSVGSPRELVAATLPTSNETAQNGTADGVASTPQNPPPPPHPAATTTKKKPTKKELQKRKSEATSAAETPSKKSKSGAKTIASETSIMETIDNVIQQSVQMTTKPAKTKKAKNGKVEKKKNKKNSVNLLSSIKRASKKLDIVKAVVSEKLGLIKNEIKNSQQKINSKVDAKLKSKVQNVKTKNIKVKAKILQVKSKVLEAKNNNKLAAELKNNKLLLEATKNNNKLAELKNNKLIVSKNENKMTEAKSSNKLFELKSNKFVEAKNGKNKSLDAKGAKDCGETGEPAKDSKDTKSNVVPVSSTPAAHSKEAKVGKLNNCAKKGKTLHDVAPEPKKCKKKGKGAKKSAGRRDSFCKIEEQIREPPGKCVPLIRKPFLKPKWSNGWSWEGEAFEAKVYLTNEESAIRRCYVSMRHESGDVLRPLDCVLLKSGPRKADLPFVAKIAALWENPDDGEMMFSLLWYYRPEHTEQGRTEYDTDDEVFASRHRDANSVACIEDKCYILTFNEYCRYRKNIRRMEEGLDCPGLIVPPGDQLYPREARQPPIPVPQDMVLFCRRVYDYRGKKLVKNPG